MRDGSLWRDRDFRLVLGGQSVSAFGDAVTFTALPLLVVMLTGSGVVMGIVGVLQTLPDLLLGLPVGALADRWDRRRMIIWADLGRAMLTALIPISYLLGWPTLPVILLVTFPISCLRMLFLAAWTSMVPALVGRDQVGRASGAMEAVFSFSFILGPAIAGLLVSTVGAGLTLLIDAATFALSAGAMTLVRRRLRAERATTRTHLGRDIAEGLRYLVRQPTLRVLVAHSGLLSVTTAPLVAGVIYFLTVDLGTGSDVVGLVLATHSLGYLVGALLAGRLAGGPLGRVMLVANGGIALGLFGFAVVQVPAVQFVMSFAVGTCSALWIIPYITLRSTITPDALLGRVGATARTISFGLQPMGMLIGGIALDTFGGAATLVGVALVIGGLSLTFSVSPTLRRARVPVREAPPDPPAAPSAA